MKPFKLKIQEPSEALVQDAVLKYLAWERRVAWAKRFNSGAHVVEATATTRRRYIRYGFTGCADILGQLADGTFLAVECKRPGGRVRKEQREFIDLVNANGGVGVIAESVNDVLKAIILYGQKRTAKA